MNIVIIGNPKRCGDKIKEIAAVLTESGINVRYPTSDMLETNDDLNIQETFSRIDWADFVLAIPREGLGFDHSTMGEVAYAKHVRKPVFVYYE